jgi:hypothetical protein
MVDGGWQVVVNSVTPDATSTVLARNQFNDKPKPGEQFFIANITVTYNGQGSGRFDGRYRLRTVGAASVSYSTFDNSCGVIPDELPDSETFSGGSLSGNVCWSIRSSDAASLVMYDNPLSFGTNQKRVFISLKPQ